MRHHCLGSSFMMMRMLGGYPGGTGYGLAITTTAAYRSTSSAEPTRSIGVQDTRTDRLTLLDCA